MDRSHRPLRGKANRQEEWPMVLILLLGALVVAMAIVHLAVPRLIASPLIAPFAGRMHSRLLLVPSVASIKATEAVHVLEAPPAPRATVLPRVRA